MVLANSQPIVGTMSLPLDGIPHDVLDSEPEARWDTYGAFDPDSWIGTALFLAKR